MPRRPPARNAFDRAETPAIACFNRATVDLGVEYKRLINALQVYVSRHVAPVWGTPANLRATKSFVRNAWAIVF